MKGELMKRWLLSALVLLPVIALLVMGCADPKFLTGGGGGDGGGGLPPGPVGPPAFSGKVLVLAAEAVPIDRRPAVLQEKAQFEAQGMQVVGDGTLIVRPPAPAAGWTAEFGNQRVFLDMDGTFAFQPPADG